MAKWNDTRAHCTFSSSASVNCLATLPPPADEAATISLVFGRAAFVHIEFGSSDCAYPDSLPFRSDVLMLDACVHLAPFTQVSVSLNSSVFAKATVSNTGNSVNITCYIGFHSFQLS
ncbi:hypothetical protein HK100_011237 [Physocladia obscura]|uniref:Uncharacterized protein n=1 Tax=Physocladia obscura TaxID=109957 RepID=A0AAD5T1P5_9FUNG|nr:hypothetical protein HK100_011237 [Physocladia obscura]